MTYDVAKVLQYIGNSYSKMSLECLTKKLATLMCILSGQRSQTMSLLNTNYMHIDENHYIFYTASLLKITRPGFRSILWNSGDTLTNLYVLLHILSGFH